MTPTVSILVCCHNRVELTRSCLDSIFLYDDPDITTEIIVVNDCSTDETADYLNSLGNRVQTIHNATRGTFSQNNNAAAAQAKGRFLCLLNNDTIVTKGWLGPLIRAAISDPEIGIVGNLQLTPATGKIDHAGMVIDDRGQPIHLYKGKDANFPPALVSREFQLVTAACWLVPRDLFLSLGGLDTAFVNGYEDVDFCLRCKERARKIFYVADSVIYHYGGSSPNRFDRETENMQLFRRKWQQKIHHDLQEYLIRDNQTPNTEMSRGGGYRSSHSDPTAEIHFAVPMERGNAFSWVGARLALACQERGIVVSVAKSAIHQSIEPEDRMQLARMMERDPSSRAHVKFCHYWPGYLDQELSGRVNTEIFTPNYRYGSQNAKSLDLWMRHTLTNPHRKLAVSQYAFDALTEIGVAPNRCRIVPLGYAPEILNVETADDRYRQQGFVFLAITNGHDPYRYGTDILLRAFRNAFSGRRDVLLVLKDYGAGAVGPLKQWAQQTAKVANIIHLDEFVSKEALIRLYRGADVFVAPFRGEGFGMKILDACAVGLPVLAPAYGGPADYLKEGSFYPLRYNEVPVGSCLDRSETIIPSFAKWVEVDADDLAQQMINIAKHPCDARERGLRAREFCLQEFSWTKSAERLATALEAFEAERDAVVSSRSCKANPAKKLSVIMPTFNRPNELARCLDAYKRQTLPNSEWELIISDDASHNDVGSVVNNYRGAIDVHLISNLVNRGAGIARNVAVPVTQGEMVVFTGDDTIPEPNFLAEHAKAHARHPDDKIAVLGYIDWHPDANITPMMEYITGEGCQQFGFQRLVPNTYVPFGYFYTSNVSLKRSLLIEQEEIFSEQFVGYAHEDVELGLRLSLRGMRLLYLPTPVVKHLHPMTDADIYRRQYRLGRTMLQYFLLHPSQMNEHRRNLIRRLELIQNTAIFDMVADDNRALQFDPGPPIEDWILGVGRIVNKLPTENVRTAGITGWGQNMIRQDKKHIDRLLKQLYEKRFELGLLDGIADEWFGGTEQTPSIAKSLLRVEFLRELFLAPSLNIHQMGWWEQRIGYLEKIRGSHPFTASILRATCRFATSIAKRLVNSGSKFPEGR